MTKKVGTQHANRLVIPTPTEFNFDLCLSFLKRSPREILHRCDEDVVFKAIQLKDEVVVVSLHVDEGQLVLEFQTGKPSIPAQQEVVAYIREWFDLDSDLKPFYALAKKDELLKPLARKFYGYRIIGQPDLFESLIWAVIGQQINLSFAYTIKQRFVEKFGEMIVLGNQSYFLFPQPQLVANLRDEDLLALQFSQQKSKYARGIAEAFASGEISKEKLCNVPLLQAKEQLMKIKGIGNWTANYALMKTFRYPDAFPLEDAGLHNAIRNQLGLKEKPSLDRVKKIFKKYKGWEAYATLYLWKSL
jgi:DNA-3-methyladenine glycosylase II